MIDSKQHIFMLSISLLMIPLAIPASTNISGSVKGVDGKIPELSHIHLLKSPFNLRETIITEEISRNGNFYIETEVEGLYYILITAVNHKHYIFPVILNGDEIDFSVKLARYDYLKDIKEVSIIGEWNNFSRRKAGKMTEGMDGKFYFKAIANDDTTGYQLSGVTEDSRTINDPGTGLFGYDGGGDYISYIVSKPGSLTIVFNPEDIRRASGSNEPELTLKRSNIVQKRLIEIDRKIDEISAEYSEELAVFNEVHGEKGDFEFNWKPAKEFLFEKFKSRLEHIKKFSALQLCMLMIEHDLQLNEQEIEEIINILPPESELYTIYPYIPLVLAENSSREESILSEFYRNNKDRMIKALSLTSLAMLEKNRGNRKKSEEYYYKLKEDYGDIRDIQYYLNQLDPESSTAEGKKIPEFEVKLLRSQKMVSSDDLLGKYVLIDFWASWCPPCIEEMPHLHDMWEKYKGRNFTILSISVDNHPEDVKEFQEEWEMPWMNTILEDGFSNPLVKRFNVVAVPTPFLFNPDGRILASGVTLRGEKLKETLEKYLGE